MLPKERDEPIGDVRASRQWRHLPRGLQVRWQGKQMLMAGKAVREIEASFGMKNRCCRLLRARGCSGFARNQSVVVTGLQRPVGSMLTRFVSEIKIAITTRGSP